MIVGRWCADTPPRSRSATPGLHRGGPGPAPAGVAFVLSGGGNLGASQVGGLLALLDAGIQPDVIVGCSVGSLNGTFLAADPTVAQAESLASVWRALTAARSSPPRGAASWPTSSAAGTTSSTATACAT